MNMRKLLLPFILISGLAFGEGGVKKRLIKVDCFCADKKEHLKKNKRQFQKGKPRQHRKYKSFRACVRVAVIGGIAYYVGYNQGKNGRG
jgi:hypothetical protein|tara:strand:+ start:175 stop:441 length:267 start_codon:yes stop_codon:yes gene_type:complete